MKSMEAWTLENLVSANYDLSHIQNLLSLAAATLQWSCWHTRSGILYTKTPSLAITFKVFKKMPLCASGRRDWSANLNKYSFSLRNNLHVWNKILGCAKKHAPPNTSKISASQFTGALAVLMCRPYCNASLGDVATSPNQNSTVIEESIGTTLSKPNKKAWNMGTRFDAPSACAFVICCVWD